MVSVDRSRAGRSQRFDRRSINLDPKSDINGADGIVEYHHHVARFIEGRPLRDANRLLRAVGALFRENGGLLDVRFAPIDEALEICRETERLGRPLTDEERHGTVAAVRQRTEARYEQLSRACRARATAR